MMQVTCKLTPSDNRKGARYLQRRHLGRYVINVLIAAFIIAQPFLIPAHLRLYDWLIMFVLWLIAIRVTRNQVVKLPEQTITITEDYLQLESTGALRRVSWRLIKEVRPTDDYIFMGLNARQVVIVPRRAFDSRAASQDFAKQAFDYWMDLKP